MTNKSNVRLASSLTVLLATACTLGGLIGTPGTPPPAGVSALATMPPTATPTVLPAIYATMNVNPYETFSVYRKPELWQAAIGEGTLLVEDFEGEAPFSDIIKDGYLLDSGFRLKCTSCYAVIWRDTGLIERGKILHVLDFGNGLSIAFPNATAVSAFAFEYRAAEDWMLRVDQTVVPLQTGRDDFVGVVFLGPPATEFGVSSNTKGSLSVVKISYLAQTFPEIEAQATADDRVVALSP